MSAPSDPAGGPPADACNYWDPGECTGTPACPARCPRFLDRESIPLTVRPYREEDCDALATMYDEVPPKRRTMGLPPGTASKRARWLDKLTADGWNLLATHDDEILGHVAAVPADGDEPSIWVFVRGGWEGRGVGTELVRQVIAHAAERGYEALELHVDTANERAVHVYRQLGFEVQSLEERTYHMRLDLSKGVADRVRLPPAERSE
jgi:ribosomal protein S18 acetylase RimI-like enzyme